eukprot:GFUD01032691.1.p1 GENE.GFUD01032691.1~~GFUD01032691.1.p1  ORF type:complete len:637 (+),score=160.30 GFUD01032691.1:48-1958(+)
MSRTPASDEGSDVEIEEVEVLNPLDLSIEEAFQSDNVHDSFQGELGRDISIDSEHYDDNQDNAIDQTGSGSDTDHLDVEVEDDEESASVVIENPNDVTEGSEEETSTVESQNWVNIGASTSSQIRNNPFRTKIPVHRLLPERAVHNVRSSGANSELRNLVTKRHQDGKATESANSDIEMCVESPPPLLPKASQPQVVHQKRVEIAKRPSNILLDSAVSKKPRQSEQPAVNHPNTEEATAEPVEPPENVPQENPSYEDLLAENARLKQDLSNSTSDEASLTTKYESLVTKLQAKVECPVCFDVPKQAPVPVCPNGHVVCQGCKRDLCPTCRVRMGLGTSLLAVTVIENIPHSCEFQIYGCQASCSIVSLPTHQANCAYRAVKCPNFNCAERVPLTLLAEHTLRRCIHNGTFYNTPLSNSYNYIIPANQTDQFDNRRNSTWRPDGITFDGKNFFLKITRKGKKAMWYFYVQMAGSEVEAKQYTATIYVFRTSVGVDGRNSHRFIRDICHIDLVSTDRAAESGYCCELTDAQMKRVLGLRGTDKKFRFTVEVWIETREDTAAGQVVESADANESLIDTPATPNQTPAATEVDHETPEGFISSEPGQEELGEQAHGLSSNRDLSRHSRSLRVSVPSAEQE